MRGGGVEMNAARAPLAAAALALLVLSSGAGVCAAMRWDDGALLFGCASMTTDTARARARFEGGDDDLLHRFECRAGTFD